MCSQSQFIVKKLKMVVNYGKLIYILKPDLSRLPPTAAPDGKWTKNSSSMCKPPPLRYLSILFLKILTLVAFTQSVDNLFHSFHSLTLLCFPV